MIGFFKELQQKITQQEDKYFYLFKVNEFNCLKLEVFQVCYDPRFFELTYYHLPMLLSTNRDLALSLAATTELVKSGTQRLVRSCSLLKDIEMWSILSASTILSGLIHFISSKLNFIFI